MIKQIFFFAFLLAFLFTGCKQEQLSPQSPESNLINITNLTDSANVFKLKIGGYDTYVKQEQGSYYIAEDITITNDQFALLQQMADPTISTIQRSAIGVNVVQTWPNNAIPYRLPDQDILPDQDYERFIISIKRAFDMISARTSVRFVEHTNETEYIHFLYSTVTNSSPLGWGANRINQINIFNTTFPAIIAHEIMHSMGFVHEQTRPDRDNYVRIYLERAIPNAFWQFVVWPWYTAHGAFDFESVMIYSSFAFAIDPNIPVMTKLDGSTFDFNLERLSEGDYAGINALYPAR